MRTEQDCRSRAIKLEQSQDYKDLRLVCSEDLFGTALLLLERRLWKYQPSGSNLIRVLASRHRVEKAAATDFVVSTNPLLVEADYVCSHWN